MTKTIVTTPSRRGFLAVLSAGAAATVAPAALAATLAPATETPFSGLAPGAATPSPDAGLLQLIDDYRIAKAEADRAGTAFSPYEEKWFSQRSKLLQNPPEVLRARPEDRDLLPMSAGGVLQGVEDGFYGIRFDRGERYPGDPFLSFAFRWLDPSPAGRVRADEIIAAHNKLRKRYDRKPAGYRAAERAMEAANARLDAVLASIRKTRARSPAGLIAKARLAREDSMDAPMALSLVEDLCALSEPAAA